MLKTTSYSIEDTKKFAKLVLQGLVDDRREKQTEETGALVLVLKGDLGAGKTAFTKCIGEILGVKEEITSPTFTIEKRYSVKNKDFKEIEVLIHIDAFRLESGREILAIDFVKDLENPQNLICFEWPEMVEDTDVLPRNSPIVELEFVDENTRRMTFNPTPNEISVDDMSLENAGGEPIDILEIEQEIG